MSCTVVIVESQCEISEFIPHFQNSKLELYLEIHIDTVLSFPKLNIICTCIDLLTSYFSTKEKYVLCRHIFSLPQKFYIIEKEVA